MRKASFFRENGLSLAFFGLTLLALGGHAIAGHAVENGERSMEHAPPLTLFQYLGSDVFLSTLFENWESEFIQMCLFVLLSVWLRQKGSSESKPLAPEPEEPFPVTKDSPWPVRRGGVWLALYEHSLSLGLFALFACSFFGHWIASYKHHHGEPSDLEHLADRMIDHVTSCQFWFESFQNWQSEFFSIAVLVLLSIHLREKGSPQSKPVAAPASHTGQ